MYLAEFFAEEDPRFVTDGIRQTFLIHAGVQTSDIEALERGGKWVSLQDLRGFDD